MRVVLTAAVLLVHLVCFAAYVGSGFAQTRLMKRSATPGLAAEIAREYEELVATIITKIELPAILGSIASGIVFVSQAPAFLKQGWLHGKLTCVLLLAILSHLEMFNARAIVRARAAGGSGATAEIERRKKRHDVFGTVGALAVVGLLICVTFLRLR